MTRPAAFAIGTCIALLAGRPVSAQAPGNAQSPSPSAGGKAEPIEEVNGQAISVRGVAVRNGGDAERVQAPGGILDNRVDKLLSDWSLKTAKIKSLYATFKKTTEEKTWGTKSTADGSARYCFPNLARLDQEGEDAESYVLTGKEVWHYRVPLKQIKIYELPPEMQNKQGLQDGPLPFLFAADPAQAKARYKFQIEKETERELQILIKPKFEADRENFSQAEVWLDREKLLPNKLFFVEPNGNRVTFHFTGIWTNIPIKETDFVGQPVEGWQVMRQKVDDQKSRRPPVRSLGNSDR